jgi:ESCRT-II complex subunit VPS22
MWSELLGLGDFYYELGVQIVEACLATRPYNGGLIPLDELTALVQVKTYTVVEALLFCM